jgi:hypothetical protein
VHVSGLLEATHATTLWHGVCLTLVYVKTVLMDAFFEAESYGGFQVASPEPARDLRRRMASLTSTSPWSCARKDPPPRRMASPGLLLSPWSCARGPSTDAWRPLACCSVMVLRPRPLRRARWRPLACCAPVMPLRPRLSTGRVAIPCYMGSGPLLARTLRGRVKVLLRCSIQPFLRQARGPSAGRVVPGC